MVGSAQLCVDNASNFVFWSRLVNKLEPWHIVQHYATITKHSSLNLIDGLQFPRLTVSIGTLVIGEVAPWLIWNCFIILFNLTWLWRFEDSNLFCDLNLLNPTTSIFGFGSKIRFSNFSRFDFFGWNPSEEIKKNFYWTLKTAVAKTLLWSAAFTWAIFENVLTVLCDFRFKGRFKS